MFFDRTGCEVVNTLDSISRKSLSLRESRTEYRYSPQTHLLDM